MSILRIALVALMVAPAFCEDWNTQLAAQIHGFPPKRNGQPGPWQRTPAWRVSLATRACLTCCPRRCDKRKGEKSGPTL